jgi:hypothetical protein
MIAAKKSTKSILKPCPGPLTPLPHPALPVAILTCTPKAIDGGALIPNAARARPSQALPTGASVTARAAEGLDQAQAGRERKLNDP